MARKVNAGETITASLTQRQQELLSTELASADTEIDKLKVLYDA
jgi:hypothetical protein